jgi:hypothetical protein
MIKKDEFLCDGCIHCKYEKETNTDYCERFIDFNDDVSDCYDDGCPED